MYLRLPNVGQAMLFTIKISQGLFVQFLTYWCDIDQRILVTARVKCFPSPCCGILPIYASSPPILRYDEMDIRPHPIWLAWHLGTPQNRGPEDLEGNTIPGIAAAGQGGVLDFP